MAREEKVIVRCSAALRALVCDVLLPPCELALQALNLRGLWLEGHAYWFWVTLGLLLVPGTLELIYWLVELCKAARGRSRYSKRAALWWMMCYGPATFHVAVWMT